MSKPKTYVYAMCLGGAGDVVTASSTILNCHVDGKSYFIAIDCGIAQGKDSVRYSNFPITGKNLDAIIITHAHMDHFGGLAYLKDFKGKVYATNESFILGEPILYDSANNYVKEAADMLGMSKNIYHDTLSKIDEMSRRKKSPQDIELYKDLCDRYDDIEQSAVYSVENVENIRKQFCKIVPYQVFVIAKGVYGRLIPNSHLLGAVSVEIYVGEVTDSNSVNISFSGDIGARDNLLYRTMYYEPNKYIQYAWIESIHGLEPRTQSVKQAYKIFKSSILDGYSNDTPLIIVVPSLDRSAKVLCWINQFCDEYDVLIPVYWDTPLGYKELLNYQRIYTLGKSFWFKEFKFNPFDSKHCKICDNTHEHYMALSASGFKIVIVASPFNDNGRVGDYYRKYISDKDAHIMFVSWLIPDCTSHILANAKFGETIEILGEKYHKYCRVTQILAHSGHGNLSEYLEYISRFPNLKGLVINHGERNVKNDIAEYYRSIYEFKVIVPELYDDAGGDESFYLLDSNEITSVSALDGFKIFEPIF